MSDLVKRLRQLAGPHSTEHEAADHIVELEQEIRIWSACQRWDRDGDLIKAEDKVKELKAELILCHKIIKHGANTENEVAYVFDIEQQEILK